MKKRIGIIGGGQLGLMISQAAHRLNAYTVALDPSPHAPAFFDTDNHIVSEFDNRMAIKMLAEQVDVICFEFENVLADILHRLQNKYNVPQNVYVLSQAQDRLYEKNYAEAYGLPTVDYCMVDAMKEKNNYERKIALSFYVAQIGLPCILKTRRLGYDGKGQVRINNEKELSKAVALLDVDCILEECIDFDFECSIIFIRSEKQIIHFPIAENVHRNGILDLSIVPAPSLTKDMEARIIRDCELFMEKSHQQGILAIELFVKGDEYYFNEMAPRPHNSGHYTIEGCNTSQYRELCHLLLDMPLETPRLMFPTVMKNILGENVQNVEKCEQISNAHIHMYGKNESRPKRKMGHITFTNTDKEKYDKEYASLFLP